MGQATKMQTMSKTEAEACWNWDLRDTQRKWDTWFLRVINKSVSGPEIWEAEQRKSQNDRAEKDGRERVRQIDRQRHRLWLSRRACKPKF